jgi:radical SAM superfamily enzyme YgiQ (UPF0313 family)
MEVPGNAPRNISAKETPLPDPIRADGGISRINFVEPGAPDLHIFSRFRLPRIGCVLLATILREAGYQTRCFCEDMWPLRISEIADADLVCISTVTSTAPRAYEMADELRRRGVKVCMGGPHVTFVPDEALEHCDWAFRGEADEWITQAVAAIDERFDPAEVRGLSWRDSDGSVYHNERPDFVRDLNSLPAPDFGLLQTGFGMGFRRRIVPVMTSRGCPYDCSFCSVTPMFGRCYRFKSLDRVMAELHDRVLDGEHVFFYDDHFCANPKRSHQLLDALLADGSRFRWSAQVRADIARDEGLIEKMSRAGCDIVYIGMESVNPETLSDFNKGQTVEDMEKSIRVFRRNKISIHGMFVLGADTDTVRTLRETARFALRNRIQTVQFLILTPLPGTRHYEELRRDGRLILKDWGLYDGQHVVYRPGRMSVYELQVETLKATLKFYSKRQVLKQFMRFEFTNSIITAYARKHAKQWLKGNSEFISRLKSLGAMGAPYALAGAGS